MDALGPSVLLRGASGDLLPFTSAPIARPDVVLPYSRWLLAPDGTAMFFTGQDGVVIAPHKRKRDHERAVDLVYQHPEGRLTVLLLDGRRVVLPYRTEHIDVTSRRVRRCRKCDWYECYFCGREHGAACPR